jgi:hypothetical protein
MAAMANDNKDKEPIPVKTKNLFVFKTDKKFVGAQIEVVQANGNIIAKQVLLKRKMIVDFDNVKLGAYTIRITKGNQIQEFQYEKK